MFSIRVTPFELVAKFVNWVVTSELVGTTLSEGMKIYYCKELINFKLRVGEVEAASNKAEL